MACGAVDSLDRHSKRPPQRVLMVTVPVLKYLLVAQTFFWCYWPCQRRDALLPATFAVQVPKSVQWQRHVSTRLL